MSLRRMVPALVLAAAAVVITLVLVVRADGVDKAAPPVQDGPEVAVDVRLLPRSLDFGDTLTAVVDVTVDRRRVDPATVEVRQEFSPWGLLKRPERTRRDAEDTTLLRTTYVMRCVISPCVPPRESAQLEFDPVVVRYRLSKGNARHVLEQRWPTLVTHSNVIASDLERREAVNTPWRADLVSLPEPTYAASPALLRGLFFGAALVLALAGVALALLAMPKREIVPEPEPEPEPEPALPPLELALILLTEEVRANGAADRRRALELVAEEMEARDVVPLARRARAMAWSEETPTLAETSGLAASVRAQLVLLEPEEEPADEEQEEADAPAPAP
jgi:hypothetical protein